MAETRPRAGHAAPTLPTLPTNIATVFREQCIETLRAENVQLRLDNQRLVDRITELNSELTQAESLLRHYLPTDDEVDRRGR
jgi:regulator of replication initiation timing